MRAYLGGRESVIEAISLDDADGSPMGRDAVLIGRIRGQVKALEQVGAQLVFTLDARHPDLDPARALLTGLGPEDPSISDTELGNSRTPECNE